MFYDTLISKELTVREAFETAIKTVDASAFNLRKEKGDHFLWHLKGGLYICRLLGLGLALVEVERRVPPPQWRARV